MMANLSTQFNWIDSTILGIVGVSAVISFFRGFVREAISMVAWIAGLLLALKYATHLQSFFNTWVESEPVRYFLSFVVIFLLTVIAGLIINLLVGLVIKSTGLSFLDRFVGIVFGTLRGMAVVAVLLLMFTSFGSFKDSQALIHSKLANQFKPAVVWLNGFLPGEMKLMATWIMQDYRNHSGPQLSDYKRAVSAINFRNQNMR